MITIGFMALAIACYAIGLALPGGLFLLFGVGFELAFWARLFRRR